MKKKYKLLIQGIAALIQNANFKGFFTGEIYQGAGKNICVPGLNCYSCPGAVGSCPIGSLQNSLSSYKFKFPYYVLGLLFFFGALLGRFICGFLCPFGLFQDLIYFIPFPKKIRNLCNHFKADPYLRYIKYVILLLMVILFPILFKLTPVFCKYLCPSGTLSGLILMISNHELFDLIGNHFLLKLGILISIVLISVLIFRPFCKYLCPLGAIYGFFNRISLLQIKVDTNRCNGCGMCKKVCDMNVDIKKTPSDAECIRCGRCMEECSQKAIRFGTLFPTYGSKTQEQIPK